jgi:peptidoglycan/xylan/chitin deacetylase (PgdA/CDA1 family)
MLDAILFAKTPKLITTLYPDCLWKVNTKEKTLYLTFDDGPIPEVTPFVLEELKTWSAKATFFCIGKNIEANPELFKRIIKEGHGIGNHTYDHLSGWNHTNKTYFENIKKCQDVLTQHSPLTTQQFFRPPYGRLKISQYRALKSKYKIVMWDIITFDFDTKTRKSRVLKTVLQHAKPGSVIVFHDSLKAKSKMEYALPQVLEHYSDLGYSFSHL